MNVLIYTDSNTVFLTAKAILASREHVAVNANTLPTNGASDTRTSHADGNLPRGNLEYEAVIVDTEAANALSFAAQWAGRGASIIAFGDGGFLNGEVARLELPLEIGCLTAALRLCGNRPVLDSSEISRIWVGTATGAYIRVVKMFIAEADIKLPSIQGLYAKGDSVQVEILAHALRGAACQIGASAVEAAAGRLEHRVRAQGLEAVQPLITDLVHSLTQAKTAFRDLITKMELSLL